MLSFLPNLPLPLVLAAKSFHLFLPSSSSRLALTLRGALAGRAEPSPLAWSLRAWLASVGLISAAAEITPGGGAGEDAELPEVPSALRLRESVPEMGRMSLAVKFSTFAYDLNETR